MDAAPRPGHQAGVVLEHKASWWAALTTQHYRRYRVLVSCRSCGLEDWGLTVRIACRNLAKNHTSAECQRWTKERKRQAEEAEAAWCAYLADEEAWRAAVLRRLSRSATEGDVGAQAERARTASARGHGLLSPWCSHSLWREDTSCQADEYQAGEM